MFLDITLELVVRVNTDYTSPFVVCLLNKGTNFGTHAGKIVYWKVFTYYHTMENVSVIIKLTSEMDF